MQIMRLSGSVFGANQHLNNISKKWTMPLRDWKGALNRFTIQFEERMTSV
jgi:transposase-like protein